MNKPNRTLFSDDKYAFEDFLNELKTLKFFANENNDKQLWVKIAIVESQVRELWDMYYEQEVTNMNLFINFETKEILTAKQLQEHIEIVAKRRDTEANFIEWLEGCNGAVIYDIMSKNGFAIGSVCLKDLFFEDLKMQVEDDILDDYECITIEEDWDDQSRPH